MSFTLSFVVAMLVINFMSCILSSTNDMSFTVSFDNFMSFKKSIYCTLSFNLFIKELMSFIVFKSVLCLSLCPSLVKLNDLHNMCYII